MKILNWARILDTHPILSSLDPKCVQWLLGEEISMERSYEAGGVILREGEASESIFVIGCGSAEAVLNVDGGRAVPLSVMQAGETFGEMAFFERKVRSATVTAREACMVLEIKAQEARRLIDEHPHLGVDVLLKVSERLRNKNKQILTLFAAEQQARAEAEDANRAKDQFLAMLGHELRNPLGAISTAAQVLDTMGHPDDGTARLREIIIRQTRQLSRMVDDLLDASQFVSGQIRLQRRSEDLRGLALRVLSAFHEAGKTADHVITLAGDPVKVDADPVRLEQVVSNLLDNALKYTPPGGQVAMTVIAQGGDAVLSVRDTGIGIAPDVLSRIFQPFVRAQDTGGVPPGLGLGLALVKRLVELHGGSVMASSPGPHRGSEFIVRLPLGAPDAPLTPPSTRPESCPQAPRRILVVDDNSDFRAALRTLLEMWGHRVEEAPSAGRALEIVAASRPEIVLVDVGLPDVDGYAVARAVRSSVGGDRVTLLAITGYGGPEDRRQAADAGFDGHLTKPIEIDELARLLSRGADARA